MIKLQLLLRRLTLTPELEPDLRARLEALGMHVTGVGNASVAAEITPQDFEALFGPPPATHAGSVATPQAAPALPVPHALADAITLITIASRHVSTP
jgi:hypothetical protein